jgi:hypothetical protein
LCSLTRHARDPLAFFNTARSGYPRAHRHGTLGTLSRSSTRHVRDTRAHRHGTPGTPSRSLTRHARDFFALFNTASSGHPCVPQHGTHRGTFAFPHAPRSGHPRARRHGVHQPSSGLPTWDTSGHLRVLQHAKLGAPSRPFTRHSDFPPTPCRAHRVTVRRSCPLPPTQAIALQTVLRRPLVASEQPGGERLADPAVTQTTLPRPR